MIFIEMAVNDTKEHVNREKLASTEKIFPKSADFQDSALLYFSDDWTNWKISNLPETIGNDWPDLGADEQPLLNIISDSLTQSGSNTVNVRYRANAISYLLLKMPYYIADKRFINEIVSITGDSPKFNAESATLSAIGNVRRILGQLDTPLTIVEIAGGWDLDMGREFERVYMRYKRNFNPLYEQLAGLSSAYLVDEIGRASEYKEYQKYADRQGEQVSDFSKRVLSATKPITTKEEFIVQSARRPMFAVLDYFRTYLESEQNIEIESSDVNAVLLSILYSYFVGDLNVMSYEQEKARDYQAFSNFMGTLVGELKDLHSSCNKGLNDDEEFAKSIEEVVSYIENELLCIKTRKNDQAYFQSMIRQTRKALGARMNGNIGKLLLANGFRQIESSFRREVSEKEDTFDDY